MSATGHTVGGLITRFACLLAVCILTGCATVRQVAADHPKATRVVVTSLALSAAATAAKAGK